jgi:dienelactone hydrolase
VTREHAVLIPTRAGPVGGIVSEPSGPASGALVLLQGLGPPARAGVNALWARIARELAARGLLVLRFDFACEGESTLAGVEVDRGSGWRRSTDLAMLREVAPWFLERSGEGELLLAGVCHGARVALEFAASEATAAGLFLVVPYLWHREPHLRGASTESDLAAPETVWAGGPTLDSDEEIVAGLRAARERGPVWVLVGEKEEEQVLPFLQRPGPGAGSLELQVEPGVELHPFGHPAQQERVRRAMVERIATAAAERARPATAAPWAPRRRRPRWPGCPPARTFPARTSLPAGSPTRFA